jgi:IS1 family transposase
MANVLPSAKQVAVVGALVEGCSMRSVSRMLDVDRKTVTRILARIGDGCAVLLDETMRDLPCERLELDELWAFVAKKQRHVTDADDVECVGDTWTWFATDADTKLVPTFLVGKRDAECADAFVSDLAWRMKGRVQISTDGLRAYVAPIAEHFPRGVDYAQIVKTFEGDAIGPGRYSPPKVVATEKAPVFGAPVEDLVSTSYAERNNLNVRMSVRRYTRLTNAFSKKLEMHVAATALHFAHYNFCRVHQTLRVTPAMEAGIADHVWSIDELLAATLEGE